MILEDESVDLLVRLVHAARRCILCERYFNVTSRADDQFLTFCQNCFAELCVLHRSAIFGSDSENEKTHFKNVFSRADVIAVSNNLITVDSVRGDFLTAINMNRTQYSKFWTKAHDMRNKFVAHRDDLIDVHLPDIEICKKQCGTILAPVASLLHHSIQNGDEREKVETWYQYLINNGSEGGIELESERVIRIAAYLPNS